MRSLDTETKLFARGHKIPHLVCLTTATSRDAIQLFDHRQAVRETGKWLLAGETIVGHNVAYDFAALCREEPELLPLVFKAYADNRIKDTQIGAKLLSIARGDFWRQSKTKDGFSLKGVAASEAQLNLEKGKVRTTFGKLRGVPIPQWPREHVVYARSDAGATYLVREQIELQGDEWEAAIGTNPLWIEPIIVRRAFALYLAAAWGMRCHPVRTRALNEKLLEAKAEFDKRLTAMGILRPNGTKDMEVLSEIINAAYDGNAPMTGTGRISTSKATLAESGDPDLVALAGMDDGTGEGLQTADKALTFQRSSGKFLKTYMTSMLLAIDVPLTPDFQDLVETSRSSCRRPNLQNWPTRYEMRSGFTPREGYEYGDIDYSTLELCTFAQSALDLGLHSEVAIALQQGIDIHCRLGGSFCGLSYETMVEGYAAERQHETKFRKLAKGPNFGLPGMLGPQGLVDYCKNTFGVDITLDESKTYIEIWQQETPEHAGCFEWAKQQCGYKYGETGLVVTPRQGFVRGDCRAPQGANMLFQPQAALGNAEAAFEISRRCYTVPNSGLYGSRLVNHVHDENLAELRKDRSQEAYAEMGEIMVSKMREVACPDIPIKIDGYIGDQWQ